MIAFNQTQSPGCREEDGLWRWTSPVPRLWSTLLSAACHLPLPVRKLVYENLYEQACDIASQHFFDVTRLKTDDWRKRHGKLRRPISCEAELNQSISLMLDSLNDPHTRLIEREQTKKNGTSYPEAVQSSLLDGSIGYLRLRHFQTEALANRVAAHLHRLRQARALILDLRHNPGGSLMEAVDVAALFLKDGKIVSLKVRSGGSSEKPHYINCTYALTPQLRKTETSCSCNPGAPRVTYEKREQYMADNRPLIVLVDHETASSAELLTGALKDNGAAIVLGSQSYGKGVGQDLLPLWNGTQIRLTTFQFRTPGGFWPGDGTGATNQGIVADITVQDTGGEAGGCDDKQLQAAIARLNRGSDHYVDAALVALGRTLQFR